MTTTSTDRVLIMRDLQAVTSDGRTLAGRSTGPIDGQPVLFIAGAATGKTMTFGEHLLDELDVRLLTMDRPGMGGSTPHSKRTLHSTVDDYRTFVAGILGTSEKSIPIVANSQGAVFSLAMACAGLALSLTLVSPADEIAFPAIHRMLPKEATRLSDLAISSPDDAREILHGFSGEAMENMVLTGSPASDVVFYTSEPFVSCYRRSLTEGFANNGVGYVQDTLIAMRPWNLDFTQIDCPVRILFGAEDLTHSPDHGHVLSQRIPGASREVIPDVGGALLWKCADRILANVTT